MSTTPLPRVSGRLGNTIDLNVTFYRNGVPTDPYAIRKVTIYRSSVQPENIVAEIPIIGPSDPFYPSPISREFPAPGPGGTVPPTPVPGVFHLYWDVPSTGIATPDIFFDVWSFIPVNNVGTEPEVTGGFLEDESLWQSCCQKFWLYPDGFYCDSGLENIRLGFEPMDEKFVQPEKRTLEVGLMPLPLYDFDYNKIAPIIPQLKATISVMTDNCETIIDNDPMKIGLRQGTYRTNPFTLQYLLDTTKFLKGNYKYQVSLGLPNGESRVSPKFNLQVS